MQYTKRQHYVPRTYMKAWASDDGQVAFRRRDSNVSKITSINNLCLENYMYATKNIGNQIEHDFGELESSWTFTRDRLLDSKKSIPDAIKRDASLFMAMQSIRGRDFKVRENFVIDLRKSIGHQPAAKQIQEYLQVKMGIKELSNRELEAVSDFISIVNQEMDSARNTSVFDPHVHKVAMNKLADFLTKLDWRVESTSNSSFICADTPIIIWNPRSDEDNYRGYGFRNAKEIWFPLDPWHLLVLSQSSGRRGFWSVKNSRVDFMNNEIGSRSFEFVFSTRNDSSKLQNITLNPKKPALRFNKGPSTYRDPFGRLTESGDLIHFWIPPHD